MIQAGDAPSLAGRDRLRHRRRHRPGRRLPRAPLARRVPLREDRRPARRPADDRRRRDPARRLRAAAVDRARRDHRARRAAHRRLPRALAARATSSTSTCSARRRPGCSTPAIGFRIVTPDSTTLAALALLDRARDRRPRRARSTSGTPGRCCADEGRRHGGRRGHAPAAAHVEPAEADGARSSASRAWSTSSSC